VQSGDWHLDCRGTIRSFVSISADPTSADGTHPVAIGFIAPPLRRGDESLSGRDAFGNT
jgi:hypothetical protein